MGREGGEPQRKQRGQRTGGEGKREGVHALAWEYAKDWADETSTEDAGWVDRVSWDPTDADSPLPVGLAVRDGKPDVSWTPDLEEERDYRVMAKHSMDELEWVDVTEVEDRSGYRFFMVEVRGGGEGSSPAIDRQAAAIDGSR